MPIVSVVVPIHNSAKYLPYCLDSLVAQTFRDIEIICVDDGSTDNSAEIVQRYAEQDSRVRLLQQENLYAGTARNNGMKHASGTYLVFLDADDFASPSMVERMYEACIKNNADVCCCGGAAYDNATSAHSPVGYYLRTNMLPEKHSFSPHDISETIFNFVIPAPWNKMFRKEHLEKNNIRFQDLKRTNDLYFTYMALATSERICVVEDALVHYRTNVPSSLQATYKAGDLDYYSALDYLQKELKRRGLYEEYRKSFANRALETSIYNLKKCGEIDGYSKVCRLFKETGFLRFDILGHSGSYFYRPSDVQALIQIMDNSCEKSFTLITAPKKPRKKKRPYVNLTSWQPRCELPESDTTPVSVIIPVYNVGNYLAECLDSVTSQTLKNLEIVCVNDGSTDNSRDILEHYASEDSRIRIIDKENGGLASARNAGLREAHGTYVHFLDSDDKLVERALEYLYAESLADNLDIIFFTAESFFDPPHLAKKFKSYTQYYIREHDYPDITTGRKLFTAMIENKEFKPSACLQLIKREFLLNHGLHFESIAHEDQVFTTQCLSHAQRVRYTNAALYLRRVRPDSIMTTKRGLDDALAYYKASQLLADYFDDIKNYEPTYALSLLKQQGSLVKNAQISLRRFYNEHGDKNPEALLPLLNGWSFQDAADFYLKTFHIMRIRDISEQRRVEARDAKRGIKLHKFKHEAQLRNTGFWQLAKRKLRALFGQK